MVNKFVIQFAELQDIDSWMKMVEIVKGNFPGLETSEEMEGYKQTIIKNINRKTAICAKFDDEIVGALIFSYNAKCLSWMAVHPDHRRKGIAWIMTKKMIELFPKDTDISVTTFQEADAKGLAPRALYKKLGFVEGELVEVFDYPQQKFILRGRQR